MQCNYFRYGIFKYRVTLSIYIQFSICAIETMAENEIHIQLYHTFDGILKYFTFTCKNDEIILVFCNIHHYWRHIIFDRSAAVIFTHHSKALVIYIFVWFNIADKWKVLMPVIHVLKSFIDVCLHYTSFLISPDI